MSAQQCPEDGHAWQWEGVTEDTRLACACGAVYADIHTEAGIITEFSTGSETDEYYAARLEALRGVIRSGRFVAADGYEIAPPIPGVGTSEGETHGPVHPA